MEAVVSCPQCQAGLRLRVFQEGQKLLCPKCRHVFLASRQPATASEPVAAPPPTPSQAPKAKRNRRSKRKQGLSAFALLGIIGGLVILSTIGGVTVWWFSREEDTIRRPGSGVTPASGGWAELAPVEASFAVLMPGTPRRSNEDLNGLPWTYYRVTLPDLQTKYSVSWFAISTRPNKADVERRFQRAKAAFTDQPEYQLLHERRLTLDGHPGQELEVRLLNGQHQITRTYIVNQSCIMTDATGTGLTRTSPDVVKFLDSFRLRTPAPIAGG